MTDRVKISVSVNTKSGPENLGVVEFIREEWERMSEEEQHAEVQEHADRMISWDWEEL